MGAADRGQSMARSGSFQRMQRSCWGIVVSRFISTSAKSERTRKPWANGGILAFVFSAEVVADRLTKGGALVRKSTATSKMAPAMVRTNLP